MTVIKWTFSPRVQKGRERGFLAREKREGRRRKEAGGRGTPARTL